MGMKREEKKQVLDVPFYDIKEDRGKGVTMGARREEKA
jgi:hypothetical protein